MTLLPGGGKLSGKSSSVSTTRRPATRRSGFAVKSGNTGGTYQINSSQKSYFLGPEDAVTLTFEVPQDIDVFSGYGIWFAVDHDEPSSVKIRQLQGEKHRTQIRVFEKPNWSKLGSMWVGNTTNFTKISLEISCEDPTTLFIFEALSGTVSEPGLDLAPAALKSNMYAFSPEALFIADAGTVNIEGTIIDDKKNIVLKNCNRCGRYLPVNTHNERNHLSFSNHCTAPNRVPCQDSTFSKLKLVGDSSPSLILQNGFQLECRFCKKFYVNAPHNPQRTVAQMREDGQRRRAFELLVNKVVGKSPLVQYREDHDGKELADEIWKKFNKKCFKCHRELKLSEVNLDHTRPLALLWPLDGTATALCRECNGAKRDRVPSDFYTHDELNKLSQLTGISLGDLRSPHPNLAVIDLLWVQQDWIFGEFFEDSAFATIRQGKDTRNLIVKALDKASQRAPEGHRYNFTVAYDDFLKNRN